MVCLRILLMLLITSYAFGAQFTSYTEETTPVGTDSVYLIKSPSGTGTDRYITITNMQAYWDTLFMSDVVDDTTPQLGGNLDIQTFNIEGVDATIFSYLDPTSSVQTQMNTKISTADVASGYQPLDSNLTDMSDGSPDVDEVYTWNGSNFVLKAVTAISTGVGTIFYMDDTEIVGVGVNNDNQLHQLYKEPQGGAEDVDTISCTNNTVFGEAYLYNTALGDTTIEAGLWSFGTYASVSSVIGGRVSSLLRNIYHVAVDASTVTTTGTGTSRTCTAAAGTPFESDDDNADITLSGYVQTPQGLYQITGYTSTTIVTIETPTTYTNEVGVAFNTWKYEFGSNTGTIISTTTNYVLYDSHVVQAAITIAATDKLAEIVFGISNNTTDVNFVHNGNDHYSHFHTPLVTRHNDLAGLNAGDYVHLTAAEKAALGSGDVSISGSPSESEFVRWSDGSTILGTPLIYQDISQFDGSDETPDVSTSTFWTTDGSVTLTDFDGTPVDDQVLLIRCDDNVTFDIGTNIVANNRTDDYIVDTTNGPFIAEFIYNLDGSQWDFVNAPSDVLELDAAGYWAGDGAGAMNERTFQDGTYTTASNPSGASGNTSIDLTSIPVEFLVSISGSDSSLAVADKVEVFRAPYAFTLTDVMAEVRTAPTDSSIIIDVNESGSTVLSTLIIIDTATTDSENAGTQPVISDSDIAARAEITFDVTQIGSTISGSGGKVWLIGTRSLL